MLGLLGVLYSLYSKNELREKGRYTIATIEKITGGGKGCGLSIDISYLYEGEKQKLDNNCVSRSIVGNIYKGKKIFIKFIPHNNSAIHIYFELEIPSNVIIVPPDGWNKEWMKTNISNFAEK